MPSPTEMTVQQLSRFVGTPDAPAVVDVCTPEDFALDPRIIPGAQRRDSRSVEDWASAYSGRRVVVVCQKGRKLSQGVAAWLRHLGVPAESLEGGMIGWRDAARGRG